MPYDRDNIFAKIIRREAPATIVYEDEEVIAINDIQPRAKIHVLVLPKAETSSFRDFTSSQSSDDIAKFFRSVNHIAINVLELADSGFRLRVNDGKGAGQEVMHFHVHILSGI